MRRATLLVLALPFAAFAQLPLPYATGFDNAAQQIGWQQYRTGHLSTYAWGYSGASTVSPPNLLYHDYPVGGSAADTVRDWFVSPVLDLTMGAWFTCRINLFSITGSTMPSDGCALMLLTGSADPNNAIVTQLTDFLPLVTSGNTYVQVPPVQIPSVAGGTRLAFYYQATQNWLTPGIDAVLVSPLGVGVPEIAATAVQVDVWPQPNNGIFTLRVNDAADHVLAVYDARGVRICTRRFRERTRVEEELAPGAYLYTVSDAHGIKQGQGRLMVE